MVVRFVAVPLRARCQLLAVNKVHECKQYKQLSFNDIIYIIIIFMYISINLSLFFFFLIYLYINMLMKPGQEASRKI